MKLQKRLGCAANLCLICFTRVHELRVLYRENLSRQKLSVNTIGQSNNVLQHSTEIFVLYSFLHHMCGVLLLHHPPGPCVAVLRLNGPTPVHSGTSPACIEPIVAGSRLSGKTVSKVVSAKLFEGSMSGIWANSQNSWALFVCLATLARFSFIFCADTECSSIRAETSLRRPESCRFIVLACFARARRAIVEVFDSDSSSCALTSRPRAFAASF